MKLIPEIFRKEIIIYEKPYTLEVFRWRDKDSRRMTIIVKGLFKITNTYYRSVYDIDTRRYVQVQQWDVHDITNPSGFVRIDHDDIISLRQAKIIIAKWLLHNPKLI